MEPMTKTDPKKPDSGARPGPERMCVICRQRFPKQNLTRYVRAPGGEFVPDPKKTLPGRGWYVCGRESCQTKFSKYRTAKRHRGGNK